MSQVTHGQPAVRVEAPARAHATSPGRLFETDYGYFTADAGEYVITRPDTPKPWANIVCPGDYGVALSNSGAGYAWRTHASLNRITRWDQDLIADQTGRFVYLRDQDTGDTWSATFKPMAIEADPHRCRHGIGYTTYETEHAGIASELTVFVPRQDPLELWLLTLTNTGHQTRRLSAWSYLEWCLGAAPDSHREFHRTFIGTELSDEHHAVFANKRMWDIPNARGEHWNTDWSHTAFHSVSRAPTALSGSKEAFIGQLGSLAAPRALRDGAYLGATTGRWDDGVASTACTLELRPGESVTLGYTLGAADDRAQAEALAARYRDPAAVTRALEEVKAYWIQWLDRSLVQTPDEAVNVLVNRWLKYQSLSSRLWGRTGYYQSGGAFGYRDQLQDSLLYLHLDPALTKRQMLLHAAHQYPQGHVQHWWHPITEQGLESQYSDDLLWLPFVTGLYMLETDDLPALHDTAPYLKVGDAEPEVGSLYDHCNRAIERALARRTERGLPIIGSGDWNDGFSATGLGGKGESVWVAQFLVAILKQYCPLIERAVGRGVLPEAEAQRAHRYRGVIDELTEIVNRTGWDGQWYWAASTDDRTLLGSHTATEGKIHLNTQTWSVIAGIVPDDRLPSVLESVETMLYRDYGPLLLQPAYSEPDERVGYLTRYAAGVRENGGLYTHAAAWAIQMECMLKRADKAWSLYRRLCSIYRGNDPELYQCEPYVVAANVDGPDSPLYGRGGWTWYTGSSGWLYRVLCEWIMGVRPEWEGLRVDPCLPAHWDGFTMKRLYHGHTLHIRVTRATPGAASVKLVTLDGKPAPDGLIRVAGAPAEHQVEVILK